MTSRDSLPLAGLRILAVEQMQALPYATQLLSRLGADVVKVEPLRGESGRHSSPTMTAANGEKIGATFLRNNFNKRSVCIDLKKPEGRELVLSMAKNFDVVAENSKAGAMRRLGLAYEDVVTVHPAVVYVSVSGFGNTVATPYEGRPAYAPIVEAMSGIYEMRRTGDDRPRVMPVGALGDISAALFATIGILAAVNRRNRTGAGDYVDVAMFDSIVAMTDVVTNLWSMGLRDGTLGPVIVEAFRAEDGYFVAQVAREEQFVRLCELLDHPEWTDDPRFADRQGWVEHLEAVLRPAIEEWAAGKTKAVAADELGAAGIAAGPCLRPDEVIDDEHLANRQMLVAIDRTDGVTQPIMVPGSPVRLLSVGTRVDRSLPTTGEHTNEVLARELLLTDGELAALRAGRVIA
jgi:crotonobetainyl-CoA:carnitine CoA-transferase CaiB-like acyl-CoA transferase